MNKLLIIVDCQNDFITGSLGSDEAVKIVPNICNKISNWDGDILVTYDTHESDYLETNEGKHLPIQHCVCNTEGWKLNNDILGALNERDKNYREIYKETFGAVELVTWGSYFTAGYEEIQLIGLCTDICVVSNALLLKAAYPEIRITVDEKCCAGTSVEMHNKAIDVMKSCHIEVR